jgi:hypothetical protein
VSPGSGYPGTVVVETVGQRLWEIILDKVGGWVGRGRSRRLAGSYVQLHHSRNQEKQMEELSRPPGMGQDL